MSVTTLTDRTHITVFRDDAWHLHVRAPSSLGFGRPCIFKASYPSVGWMLLPGGVASPRDPGAVRLAPPGPLLTAAVLAFAKSRNERLLRLAVVEEYPELAPHFAEEGQ